MDSFLWTRKFSDLELPHGIQLPGRSRPTRTIPDRLRIALSRGMLEDFWTLVKAGADIDARDRLSRTPLHLVIYWRKELSVVKAVLSAGADPNTVDSHGLTPLQAAVFTNSSPAIIKALLSAGAEIDKPDLHGRSPLVNCIQKKNNVPVIRTLLSAGASTKVKHLMVEAVKAKSDHEVLRLFIIAGASVNDSCCGFPPILHAVVNGDPVVVKMLLGAGAEIDFLHPDDQSTLLHHVNVEEIARELIKGGLNVNAVDNMGQTPLHRAVLGDHRDVVKTMIKAGADVHSVVIGNENNCLHLAKSAPMVKLLVSLGVDINARNRYGMSPLHSLVTSCSVLMSSTMRIQGIYVRYFMDTNFIRVNDSISTVKEMLNCGANVNARDNSNKTILESVVTHGHSKMISYMIKHGVEVCWKKLFRLHIMNQSAIQLLIKESLIGNVIVKGKKLFNSSPSEEPFLHSAKQLLAFTNQCLEEIELMKEKKVNCNNTVYHYVVEIAPRIKSLRLCPHYKITDEEYSAIFRIYRCHIAERLNQCYKRGLLLDILEKMNICAPRSEGNGMVNLINDCKFAIAKFLSNNDLYNFLVALGFVVSEYSVCSTTGSC